PGPEREHGEGRGRDRDPGERAGHEVGGRAMSLGRDRRLGLRERSGGPRAPRLPAAAVASAPAGCHLGFERLVVIIVGGGAGGGKIAIAQPAEGEGGVLAELWAREITFGPLA